VAAGADPPDRGLGDEDPHDNGQAYAAESDQPPGFGDAGPDGTYDEHYNGGTRYDEGSPDDGGLAGMPGVQPPGVPAQFGEFPSVSPGFGDASQAAPGFGQEQPEVPGFGEFPATGAGFGDGSHGSPAFGEASAGGSFAPPSPGFGGAEAGQGLGGAEAGQGFGGAEAGQGFGGAEAGQGFGGAEGSQGFGGYSGGSGFGDGQAPGPYDNGPVTGMIYSEDPVAATGYSRSQENGAPMHDGGPATYQAQYPPPPAPVPPTSARAKVTASLKAARRVKSGKRSQPGRQAQLTVARLEPWSVMKFSFVISLVAFIVLFVAVAVLYGVLSGLGVFDAMQRTVESITSSQSSSGFNLQTYLSASRVLGYTGLLGAINVVLITALSTVGSVLYNITADLAGGIEVTLKETD
jgi:hypothetical protein